MASYETSASKELSVKHSLVYLDSRGYQQRVLFREQATLVNHILMKPRSLSNKLLAFVRGAISSDGRIQAVASLQEVVRSLRPRILRVGLYRGHYTYLCYSKQSSAKLPTRESTQTPSLDRGFDDRNTRVYRRLNRISKTSSFNTEACG